MAQVGPNQTDFNGMVYNISELWYNGTIFNVSSCNPQTCSLLLGTYDYLPNLPGNYFFTIIFGILFLINIPLGIYYRTWGVLVGMGFGLGLEIAAYVFRILIHYDDFNRNLLITYLYCVTLGPAFLSAAIYLCLARIVVVYGEENSRLKPSTYSLCFVLGDFLALSLQGAGGGMAVVPEVSDYGIKTMIAGLAFQVVSLLVFALACADFALRVYRGKGAMNPSFTTLRHSRRWIGFLWALGFATTAVIIRSAYRVAELQAGFHSSLANSEPLVMIFEGTIITMACVSLTAFHPGLVFRHQWRDADFKFHLGSERGKKQKKNKKGMAEEVPKREQPMSSAGMKIGLLD